MVCSVLIPAHNEASVVGRALEALINVNHLSPDCIVVVCNGGSDKTPEIAASYGVKIIETEIPSKTNALNLGDSQLLDYPRIYLDADIILNEGAINSIIDYLEMGDKLACSPKPVMDLSNSNWFVRTYYDIWLSLPYCREGMIGAGCFALSKKGRERFEKFPDVIADDGYIRALFKVSERGMVAGAIATVTAPKDLRWLLKIKVRSRLGQMQLAKRFPELIENEEKNYSGALKSLLYKPYTWHKLLVYLYVVVVSKIMAKRKISTMNDYIWEKDESSRRML